MVRLADILKRNTSEPTQEFPKSSTPLPTSPLPKPEPPASERSQESPSPPSGGFRFSDLGRGASRPAPASPTRHPGTSEGYKTPVGGTKEEGDPRRYVTEAIKGNEETRSAVAQEVYRRALQMAESILQRAKSGQAIGGKELQDVVEELIRELIYENNELLNLACCQVVDEGMEKFLSAKLVNKAILAIEIGIGKKMNRSKLVWLGISAFLSDLGITQVLDVVSKKEAISGEDLEKIKQIPFKTVEILKKIPDLDRVVLTVAEEFRQRGENRLELKEMRKQDEFSRIVAVVDVFEALTHDRPHRPRYLPHEAMKKILEEGGRFEEGVLRLLIDHVGIYPIGSWVQLSTKDLAKVVRINPGSPLRPKVKVLFDSKGMAMEDPPLFDLAKTQSLQILRPISDQELGELVKENA